MDTLKRALQDARRTLRGAPNMDEIPMCRAVIRHLLIALGWDESQWEWQHPISAHEKEYKADFALFTNSPDYPSLIIEVKKLGSQLQDPRTMMQVETYANLKQVEVAILTDGYVWRFYLLEKHQNLKDCLALEISLEDIESSAEFLQKVLNRNAVANGKAKEQLIKSRVRVLLDDALPGLLEKPNIKQLVIQHLRDHVRKYGTVLEDTDANAFLKEKFGRKQTPSPDNSGGGEPPSSGKSGQIEVTLTLDGEEIVRIGRANTIKELVKRALETHSDFLSRLAQTKFANKTGPVLRADGSNRGEWELIGDYWVHTQVGETPLRSFINHYNEITRKGVRHRERKLP